jgi:hypothetical protein
MPEAETGEGEVQEMARELNRGRLFRIFGDRAAAEAWLPGVSNSP